MITGRGPEGVLDWGKWGPKLSKYASKINRRYLELYEGGLGGRGPKLIFFLQKG